MSFIEIRRLASGQQVWSVQVFDDDLDKAREEAIRQNEFLERKFYTVDTGSNDNIKNLMLSFLPFPPGGVTYDDLRRQNKRLIEIGKQLPTRVQELVKQGRAIESSPGFFSRSFEME